MSAPGHGCPLRGRMKCPLCGSAMISQMMITRGHSYHYSVCRIAFDRRIDRECAGRNAEWKEIAHPFRWTTYSFDKILAKTEAALAGNPATPANAAYLLSHVRRLVLLYLGSTGWHELLNLGRQGLQALCVVLASILGAVHEE